MRDVVDDANTYHAGQPEERPRLFLRFYERNIQNAEKTLAEGRPIFDRIEFVEIRVPGDKLNVLDKKVTEEHRQNYAPQYAAYKANASQDAASGTILEAWGGVPPERVPTLQWANIRTVEQYAGVSDEALQRLGPGSLAERQRARDYIAAAKGMAPTMKLRAELEEANARAALFEEQVRELAAAVAALKAEQPTAKAPSVRKAG